MHEKLKVGQYVLEHELGEGGMAEVWLARHLQLGSVAAIKFLLPGLSSNPELENRFLYEGKRQAALRHPNILQAIDFIQQDGRNYLVMQYVEGENLEAKLRERNGPLTLDEVHTISWDVLSALDYAHAAGVVHRDIKPSNILVEKSGRVWLTDFGIALALGEENRLTRTGTAVGTAAYMSPEQIVRPKAVDSRADIYSFGCVLYTMLAGSPPFGVDGETDFYIKDCHVRTPPPPIIYRNPAISPAIEQVVRKCLEKNPAERYQTCGAVMNALDAAISGKPTATYVPSTPAPIPVQATQPVVVRTPTIAQTSVATPPPAVVPVSLPTPVPTWQLGSATNACSYCCCSSVAVGTTPEEARQRSADWNHCSHCRGCGGCLLPVLLSAGDTVAAGRFNNSRRCSGAGNVEGLPGQRGSQRYRRRSCKRR